MTEEKDILVSDIQDGKLHVCSVAVTTRELLLQNRLIEAMDVSIKRGRELTKAYKQLYLLQKKILEQERTKK